MNNSFRSTSVLAFVVDVLLQAGVRRDVAELTGRGLWEASMRGTDSHGIRLLPHYVEGVRKGRINPDPDMTFTETAAACGLVDADHGFGHAAGVEAMDNAIDLASRAGVGFVAVKNSSHCGAMSYFALRAAKRNMLGLAFTHATSRVRTPGSVEAFFGTNPICFAAPMEGEEPFCFDAAPTFITANRLAQHREDKRDVPPGFVADENGQETQNPNEASMLLPIGDYKGFGWAMMVDILCGLLTGMPTGQDISKMFVDPMSQKRHLGQFYGAIDIARFVDVATFSQRLSTMAQSIRGLRPQPGGHPQVPNDPEKRTLAHRTVHGIPIKSADLEKFNALAVEYGLRPLEALEGAGHE